MAKKEKKAKHIFIGLGGSGVNIVAPIKYKIYQRTKATQDISRLEIMSQDYRFIFIDSDTKDVEKNNEIFKGLYEDGRTKFISTESELIDMGNLNPQIIYDNAKSGKSRIEKRILESCDNETSNLLDNNPIRNGAGAIKYNSRFTFSRLITIFSDRLKANITQLKDLIKSAENEEIVYWIVSSCNGGTGSGILNDVLYLVNMTHKSVFGEGDPFVVLTLCMPQIFIQKNQNNPKYTLNAFATLREIEQFVIASKSEDIKIKKLIHRLAFAEDYQQFESYKYKPFEFCIPIDSQTSTNQIIGALEEMYSNTSEMLYYIHQSQVIFSWRDNYKTNAGLEPKEFLTTMGYVALRKPLKQFEDYVRTRFRYEFLRYAIIGEDIHPQDNSAVIKEYYDAYIYKRLLSEKESNSVLRELIDRVSNDIENELQGTGDADEVKNEKNVMPISETENIYAGKKRSIDHYFAQNKEVVLNDIVSKLWGIVNETVMNYGYKYALTLLRGLDDTCTTEVLKYQSNVDKSSKSQLISDIFELQEGLEHLYEQATKRGFFGKGKKQRVSNYYQSLIGYVEKKIELDVKDCIYELLNELCIGDKGEIDHMIDYVVSVYNEAETAANNAQQDYIGVRKSYTISKLDITSIFLPDIEQFVTDTGWKPNHLFAELYGQLIEPTKALVPDYGYKPLRNGDSNSKSLLTFIKTCSKLCEQSMISNGYLSANLENNLFVNRMINNPKKIIEDIQNYALETITQLISTNEVIGNVWFKKPLASFINELDTEKLDKILKRMKPTLFFPYDINRHRTFTETKVYVASEDIAKKMFEYQTGHANQRLETKIGDDDTVYSIVANVGMSFDYYLNYSILEKQYNDCPVKKYYHFHQAIGDCNGDLSKIRLPYEAEPLKIDFVRFLIMDHYAEILKEAYFTSDNPMEKDRFTSSPLQIKDGIATILKHSAFTINDGKVLLDKGLLENHNYVQIAPGEQTIYSEIYSLFSENYINNHLSRLIKNLIAEMKNNNRTIMMQHYKGTIAEIKNNITQHWEKSTSRSEKDFMQEINQILSSELDKFEKL